VGVGIGVGVGVGVCVYGTGVGKEVAVRVGVVRDDRNLCDWQDGMKAKRKMRQVISQVLLIAVIEQTACSYNKIRINRSRHYTA
jgi:hypothetical protein